MPRHPRHTITVEELNACLAKEVWYEIACSYGDGASKKFEVRNNSGMMRVTDHGRVIYLGNNSTEAVRAYNEAP